MFNSCFTLITKINPTENWFCSSEQVMLMVAGCCMQSFVQRIVFPAIRDPFGSIALAFMHRFPRVKQYPYSWIVWMLYWSVSLFLPESCQLLEEKIVDQEKWFSSLSAGGSQKNVFTNLFLPWYFLNLGRLTVPSRRSIWLWSTA